MTTADISSDAGSIHTTDAAHRRLKKRYAFERRFKLLGMAAIVLSAAALFWLLSSVVIKALGAFTQTYMVLPVNIERAEVDPKETNDPGVIRGGNFSGLVKATLRETFPSVKARREKLALYKLVSNGASLHLRRQAMANPSIIGTTSTFRLIASDDVDLYAKGYEGDFLDLSHPGRATPTGTEGDVEVIVEANAFQSILNVVKAELLEQADRYYRQAERQNNGIEVFEGRLKVLGEDASPETREQYQSRIAAYTNKRDDFLKQAAGLERRANTPGGTEKLSSGIPSFFVYINDGVIKVTEVSVDRVSGRTLVPLKSEATAGPDAWRLKKISESEAGRRISDQQVVWIEQLKQRGQLETTFNWSFFSSADSREAELAGIWSSTVGSFWTMLITFLLAFPIGVCAAIYLEQFAPSNRITDFIEVNINNLAAVPSIVFGLLGLAIVVEFLGNDVFNSQWRSTPLAGGIVLALMSLPTIIIASRAAIKAVPPSIKEAALGVGASNTQAVFHHILPLAMPGILTGSIIAMAQALGETAPLLMIGMVAFITEIPASPMDPASVLPVQVFRWSDFPERAFEMRTAAAILVLLAFLVVMNGLAVFLRKKFERRW